MLSGISRGCCVYFIVWISQWGTTLPILVEIPIHDSRSGVMILLLSNIHQRHPNPHFLTITRILIVLLALFVAGAGCTNLGGEPEIVSTIPPQPTTLPTATFETGQPPALPPDLAVGATIFAARCTDCHGVGGQGNGQMVLDGQIPTNIADFTDPAAASNQTPNQWFETITVGNMEALMPPWANALSSEERWAVAMYTYTMAYEPDAVTMGQVVWEANCAECHGLDGANSGETGIPDLTDQASIVLLSDAALAEALTVADHDFTASLNDDERQAVSWYLRTLTLANTEPLFGRPVSLVESTPVPEATTLPATAAPEETAAVVEAPETVIGTVQGTIQNGSPGGSVPANLAVELFIINDASPGGPELTLDGVADANGNFVFENVPIRNGRTYWASVFIGGTFFDSIPGTGSTAIPNLELPITMYDTDDDPSAVTISDMLMQNILFHDGLLVVQSMTFTNSSDYAYIADKSNTDPGLRASVEVTLPFGAQIVEIDSQTRYRFSEDGRTVTDTLAIMPGQSRDVGISYFMPIIDRASITFPVNYATTAPIEIWVGDPLNADGDDLTSLGRREIGGGMWDLYEVPPDLQPGQTVSYVVETGTGTSASSSDTLSTSIILAIVLVVAGVLMVGVAAYLFLRDRRSSGRSDGDQALINELVREIGDLDQMYQDGGITEDAYQKQRQRLKDRLARLMKKG